MSTSRRAFLGGLAAAALTGATGYALARRPGKDVLRLGAMTNLTHAPMLAGLGSGRIQAALAPLVVETRLFRAGPRVAEALVGGAIDAGTAGPSAIVVHHARHRDGGAGLRVIGGCCSGGASLVVTPKSGIRGSADVRGKRLAVTQIGTAQDVSLRWWLKQAGLRDAAAGGDVTVLAIAAATILDQMKRGELDGAWLPEPWATRVVHEEGALRLIDERDLWPDRRFATAVLATRARDAERPWAPALAAALAAEVTRASQDPETALDEAHAELTRHVGNPGKRSLFSVANEYVDFTSDPLRASIEAFGEAAAALGLAPGHSTDHLFGD
ncbi:MAG: ABC transporter substrate-binding protein [Labilithrix sp.]|nr:ABC transporter substrate-binding protein [Labilithrix sp.]MCW5814494.1 ABC transporter substrate-binding protein [Labilithrix sp.]